MAQTGVSAERPISPHLTIYRWTLTMVLSIAHRLTGAALYFGMLFVAWWLAAAASGPNAYARFQAFIGSFIGLIILFGFTWALLHHLLGGVRHLIMDTGHAFGANEREWLARATLVGSVGLTILLWILGYVVAGASR